jgi:protein gp37
MSDLFHARVRTDFIASVFEVMQNTPQHTYQILTKRSKRLARLAPNLPWPKNVWIGVSVESSEQFGRIHDLASIPAVVRFLSCEPLLGPLWKIPLSHVDWVIAGGESGSKARPVDPEWVRDLRDSCLNSSTPFFFKQWGGIRAKSGGRTLDGKTWDDMPTSSARDVSTLK